MNKTGGGMRFIYKAVFYTTASSVGFMVVPNIGISDSTSTHTQRMESHGYHRYQGSWRTEQEILLLKQAEVVTEKKVEARQRLERLRRDLEKSKSSEQVAEEIRRIEDPFSVLALISAINTESVARVRLLYVEALGNIDTGDGIRALLSLVLNHPDSEVRWSAIERLKQRQSIQVVPPLVAALRGNDIYRINRAAVALKTLGDESAVQPLMRVLITQQVVTVGAGSGGKTSATFSPTGGGLALGSSQKTKVVVSQNADVLEALTTLTNKNFGWDQTSWHLWFRNQGVSQTVDIRRDL
jgi:hypothetical protein